MARPRRAARVEILERGAGYTLSSGTSSCAAAAVARRLGLCDEHIDLHLAGGRLKSVSLMTFRSPCVAPCNGSPPSAMDPETFADLR